VTEDLDDQGHSAPDYNPDYRDLREHEIFGREVGSSGLPWQPVGAWQLGRSYVTYQARADTAPFQGPNLEAINFLLARAVAVVDPHSRLERDPAADERDIARLGPVGAALQEYWSHQLAQHVFTGEPVEPFTVTAEDIDACSVENFNTTFRLRRQILAAEEEARVSDLIAALQGLRPS
jgi:hypothetical protein